MRRFFIFFFIINYSVFAQDKAPKIENPLTLQTAVKIAQDTNLIIKQLILEQQLINNNLITIESNYDAQINLGLKLEQKERYSDNIDNSEGYLSFNKSLYNQDGTIQIGTIKAQLEIVQQKLKAERIKQELIVSRVFFDAVLADLEHLALLEKLAVFAVKENHIQEYFDIGEASDLDLLSAANKTQAALTELRIVEAKQISTTANLARLLGLQFENNLDELELPDFSQNLTQKPVEFKQLRKKVLENNISLKVIKLTIKSIKKTLIAEYNNKQIAIDGYLKVGQTAFETDKNGNWIVGVKFNMPLDSSLNKNKVNKFEIELQQQQNLLAQQQDKLVQQTLELWLKIKNLKQHKKALTKQLEYRDFHLEKARADYELDLKSDIGDSMYQYTNTEYLIAKTNFDINIALKRLNLLTGETDEN